MIRLHSLNEDVLVPPGELIMVQFKQGITVKKAFIFFVITINRGIE